MSGFLKTLYFAVMVPTVLLKCEEEVSSVSVKITANPLIAETGQPVKLEVEGIRESDIDLKSISWFVGDGKIEKNGVLSSVWIPPDRIGKFRINFQANGKTDKKYSGTLNILVKRFGQPPSGGCTIPCNLIYRNYSKKDQIPVLDNPAEISVSQVKELPDDKMVIAVKTGENWRAYPLDVLAYHEVINDSLNGEKITVSYSPLADFAISFRNRRGGFGHTGMLFESFHILYDRETQSEWLPVKGECFRGKLKGEKLERIPNIRIRWGALKRINPEAVLVMPEGDSTGHFKYDRNPYDWYFRDDKHIVGRLSYHDMRLPGKTRVLGVWHGGMAITYPVSSFSGRDVLNQNLGGLNFLVLSDTESGLLTAMSRVVEGKVLEFKLHAMPTNEAFMEDVQTGSVWNILGEAISGVLKGKVLLQVPQYYGFFFAWSSFRPGSEIYVNKKF